MPARTEADVLRRDIMHARSRASLAVGSPYPAHVAFACRRSWYPGDESNVRPAP